MLKFSSRGLRAHRFSKLACQTARRSAALRPATDAVMMESLEGRMLYTAAPTNLAAVALSSTEIQLTWKNNAVDQTGFDVERSDGEGGWTDVGTTSGDTTTFSDSALAASTSYSYEVFAVGGAGGTSSAATAGATTPAAPAVAPDEPALTATAVSSSEIDLTWTAPTDSSNIELEEQGPFDTNFSVVSIPTPVTVGDSTVYEMTGLASVTSYKFRLRADLNGMESYSSVAEATTNDPYAESVDSGVPAPYDLTATTATDAGGLALDFHWDGNAADTSIEGGAGNFVSQVRLVSPADPYGLLIGYPYEWVGNTIGDGEVTAETSDFYPGFEMAVRVRYNDSAWSNWATATEAGSVLPAPSLTISDAGGGQLTASWNTPSGASDPVYYTLYGVDSSNNLQYPDQPGWDATSVTFTPPTEDTVKYFVTAQDNDYRLSGYSNFADAPGESAPAASAPASVSATPYSAGVHILWDNASNNETSFVVQRSAAGADTWSTVGTVDADVTQFDDTSVTPGTSYDYKVGAAVGGGDPTYSSTVTTTSLALPTVSVVAIQPAASFSGTDGNAQDGYFDFHRTGDLSAALTADISSAGSTATDGTDFASDLPTDITFEAGQQDILVAVVPANGSADSSTYLQAAISTGSGYSADATAAQVDLAAHA